MPKDLPKRCFICCGGKTVPDDSKGPGHRKICPKCRGRGTL